LQALITEQQATYVTQRQRLKAARNNVMKISTIFQIFTDIFINNFLSSFAMTAERRKDAHKKVKSKIIERLKYTICETLKLLLSKI